jgi:hypothetical protein
VAFASMEGPAREPAILALTLVHGQCMAYSSSRYIGWREIGSYINVELMYDQPPWLLH